MYMLFFQFHTNKKRPQWGEIRIPKLRFLLSNSKFWRDSVALLRELELSKQEPSKNAYLKTVRQAGLLLRRLPTGQAGTGSIKMIKLFQE